MDPDAVWIKDPDDVLDFQIDWSTWLPAGDTITGSTWIVPTGITKNSDTHDATTATIWLSGGELYQIYHVTNRITTTGGRTVDRTKRVQMLSR